MKRQGLTLIELLVASAIFLTVITTIYLAFHSGLFGLRNIEEAINIQQASSQVLERLNTDLRNASAYSSEEAKFSGSSNEIGFFTLADTFSDGKIIPEYAYVSYKREGDKMLRLCRKNKESLNDKSEIPYEEMAGDIEGVVFSFGYLSPEDNSLVFKEVWDDPKVMPVAIKVALTFKNKVKYDFERTIFF